MSITFIIDCHERSFITCQSALLSSLNNFIGLICFNLLINLCFLIIKNISKHFISRLTHWTIILKLIINDLCLIRMIFLFFIINPRPLIQISISMCSKIINHNVFMRYICKTRSKNK